MFLLNSHDFGVSPVSWMRKDNCFELSKLAALRPPPFFSSNNCCPVSHGGYVWCTGLQGNTGTFAGHFSEGVQLCWGWSQLSRGDHWASNKHHSTTACPCDLMSTLATLNDQQCLMCPAMGSVNGPGDLVDPPGSKSWRVRKVGLRAHIEH